MGDNLIHPDANLWSAYWEGRVRGAARRRIVHHLSRCGECRQLYAALGTMTAPPAGTRPSPWVWLAAGWDAPLALAASAVLVAAGAWWLLQAPPPIARTPVAPPPAVAPPPVVQTPVAPVHLSTVPRPAPAPANWSPVASTPPNTAPAPVPSEVAEVEPALDFSPLTTGFQDQPRMPSMPFELATWNGQSAAPALVSSPAKPPVAAVAVTTAPLGPPARPLFASGFAGGASVLPAAVGPMAPSITSGLGWAISHGGQILRSLGAGVWEAVPLVPGVHFRAIATAGATVWAAARTDEIYSSSDNGAHWRHIRLPAGAHANVRSISLSDPLHIAISANDGHSWLTSDGGATWTRE